MREFVEALAPPGYESIVYWSAVALLALVFLALIWMVVRIASRPRLTRTRSQRARLAVTDAAELGERRLVLVRRDDVEHLILIGGPNDLVIEADIVRRDAAGHAAKPNDVAKPAPPPPTPAPVPPPAAAPSARRETQAVIIPPSPPRPAQAAPQVNRPAPESPSAEQKPSAQRSEASTIDRSMVEEMDALLGGITPPRR